MRYLLLALVSLAVGCRQGAKPPTVDEPPTLECDSGPALDDRTIEVVSLETLLPVGGVVVVSTSTAGLLDWATTGPNGRANLLIPTGATVAIHDETFSFSVAVTSTAEMIAIPFPATAAPTAPPLGAAISLDIVPTGLEEAVWVSDGCRSVEYVAPLPTTVLFEPALACIASNATVTLQAAGFAGADWVSFATAIDSAVSGTASLTLSAAFDTLPVSVTFPGEVSPWLGSGAWLERNGRYFGKTRTLAWSATGAVLQAQLEAFGRPGAEALHGSISGSIFLEGQIGFVVEQRQLDTLGIDASVSAVPYARNLELLPGEDTFALAWDVSGVPDWSAVGTVYLDAFGRIQFSSSVLEDGALSFESLPVPDCVASVKGWKRGRSPLIAQVAVRDASFHDGSDAFPGFWSARCFFTCSESVAAEPRPPEYRIWTAITSGEIEQMPEP